MLLQREPRSNSFSNKLVSYLIDCQITNQIDCSGRTERPERGGRSVRKKLHELTEDELKQVSGGLLIERSTVAICLSLSYM